MKKKMIWIILTVVVVVAAAAIPLRGALPGLAAKSDVAAPTQTEVIPDMQTLLNYPSPVTILDLEGGERQLVLDKLMAREETIALITEMSDKGFVFDKPVVDATADAMRIMVTQPDGTDIEVEAMTVSLIANELSAALTAMLPVDPTAGPGFFQAHHTNLDPTLAEVPDPPIIVNGVPYFYITTLRWIGGRVIVWNYWWYSFGQHPNWYYAHYYWYWNYYWWYGWGWYDWWWWAHGWYYWRYWYYWSTWFPYHVDLPVPIQ